EQELLLGIADIAIEIFAMESAVTRALKAIAAGKPGLKPEMARVYCQEAFERIGAFARNIMPSIEEEGDTLRTQLSVLKRLMRYTPVNTIALKRKVAEKVLDKEGYAL
ncbi:MAG TPA: hypothetical protein VNT26_02560, partial [Candidatus Sulfotelmatobacter sp.]|nr:hypothetical protein [Candidatus Sulfotelmatobacter sp.]